MSESRNVENWAQPIEAFDVAEVATGTPKGNVEGRHPSGPLQGFGRLNSAIRTLLRQDRRVKEGRHVTENAG